MVVKYNQKELELLARLMRAEALGEGNLGMLMVGNVGINRVTANCLTFMLQVVEVLVLVLGGIKNLLVDIKIIVFINLILVFVRNYIKYL